MDIEARIFYVISHMYEFGVADPAELRGPDPLGCAAMRLE